MTIGAFGVDGVADLLRRRVGRGLQAWLQGHNAWIQFEPADDWRLSSNGRMLTISMRPATAIALAGALRPRIGTYTIPEAPGPVIHVEETILRDSKGAEIARVG